MKQLLTPLVKKILILVIILVTFGVFAWYLYTHPDVISQLLETSPVTLLLLAIGYFFIFVINAYILFYSLKYLRKKVPFLDMFFLTGYSSIVNFFGPLQSGPGYRAVYLKKKYHVKIKDFIGATLLFYGFFALLNGLVILTAFCLQFSFLQALLFACAGIITGAVIIYLLYKKVSSVRETIQKMRLTDLSFWHIGIGAVALTLCTATIYSVEILPLAAVSFWQILIYTAAANLALFVSLTPGAIGFRESFLVLTSQLHGIDTSAIVAANVLDRAFYVVFLAISFLLLLTGSYVVRKKLPISK